MCDSDYTVSQMSLKFRVCVPYITLCSNHESSEKRRAGFRTLRKDVNEFLQVIFTFIAGLCEILHRSTTFDIISELRIS